MAILILIMNQDLKEANLSSNFCKKDIEAIKNLIDASTSFSVVGIPGMGISIFLRYLATKSFACFIHIDIYELSSLNETEFFRLMLKQLGTKSPPNNLELVIESIKNKLRRLVHEHPRVVLIFNRFDQLKKEFNQQFFMHLRVLRDIDKERIVFIFATNRSLVEQIPDALSGGNLNMLSKNYYLKPYSPKDLLALVKLNSAGLKIKKQDLMKAVSLSGGHYQLLQLLLKSEFLTPTPLLSFPVKLQIKELFEFLNYDQRKALQGIVFKKKLKVLDPYLLNVGFLKLISVDEYEVITPLLKEYIRSNVRLKLPILEAKLFKLLKANFGKTVSKDKIFEVIWNNSEEVSDWALNSLIYRLRKNPTFVANNYVIESQKKVGYILLKN